MELKVENLGNPPISLLEYCKLKIIITIMKALTEIANRCGTDKGSFENGYTIVYDMLFSTLQSQPINLLEIGLAMGGPELGGSSDRDVIDAPSVRMWRECFPKAHIYGLNISEFSRFENDWFTFFRVDCGHRDQFDKVRSNGSLFDIILDDGSHASFHQQLTMIELFPLLRSKGIYVIEDLNWQPDQYEKTLPVCLKTTELLDRFLKNGKFSIHGDAISELEWQELSSNIASVMLIDEDYLVSQRRIYNKQSNIAVEFPNYTDLPLYKRFHKCPVVTKTNSIG